MFLEQSVILFDDANTKAFLWKYFGFLCGLDFISCFDILLLHKDKHDDDEDDNRGCVVVWYTTF